MGGRVRFLLLISLLTTAAALSGCNNSNKDAGSGIGRFSLNEIYLRYYADTTLELIASQNYGEIYPYIGGITSNPFVINQYIYGFCDAEGRVICDPVFVDLKLYEYQGKRAYVFIKSGGKIHAEDRLYKMYIAAHDGSFVMEFDEVLDGFDGSFSVRQGESWGSVDYDGNEILPCIYKYPVLFGEGLAAVSHDFSQGYSYVNKRNEIIIEQMPSIPKNEISKRAFEDLDSDSSYAYRRLLEELVFKDGRAVFFDGDKLGYINNAGEIVIPASFDPAWFYKFSNGACIVSIDDKQAVIDLNGAEILAPGNYEIYCDADVYRVYNKDTGEFWYIDSGGKIIIEPYDSDITYNYIGDGWFYKTFDHMKCDLVKEGIIYPVGVSQNISIVGENLFLAQYFGENGGIYKIIDNDGKVYFDGGENLYLNFDKTLNSIRVFKKESWLMGLIDKTGNYILEPVYKTLIPVGDNFMTYQGFYGGLIDKFGNWIIKVSLLDYIND